MNLIDLVGGGYSLYTLACAVIFPLIDAIAVFLCLRRSGTVKRILGYFLSMPIYVSICVFLLCEPQNMLCPLLERTGIKIYQPEAIGFLLAVGLGVLYLGITAAICGAGIQKKSGYAIGITLTAVFFAICIALAVMSHILVPQAIDSLVPPSVSDLLGYFGLALACNAALDIISVAAAIIYMIGWFLCFIGAGREDDESDARHRRRMSAPDIEPSCAVCEYAQMLRDSPGQVLCAKRGVVAEDHICRRFMYDPLKRRPMRVQLPTMPRQTEDPDDIKE